MERGQPYFLATRSGEEFCKRVCNSFNELLKSRREMLESKTATTFEDRSELDRIKKVQERGGVYSGKKEIVVFKNGEFKSVLNESVRDKDVFLVSGCSPESEHPLKEEHIEKLRNMLATASNQEIAFFLDEVYSKKRDININFLEAVFMLDTIETSAAERITLIMPHYFFCRQDYKKAREPITAALSAAIYKVAGVDNMMFMDIHSEKIVSAFNVLRINTDNLRGSVVMINEFKKMHKDELENLVVLSPDVGGGGRARYYSRHLESDVAIGDKVRTYQKKVDDKQGVEHITIMGDVKDKNVLILDDIIDTASTIIKVTKTALEKGSRKIYLLATHPILSGNAVENLNQLYKEGTIQELMVTDTITRSETFKKENPWYKEISVAPMFSETGYNMNFGRPVHGIYED